MDLFATISHTLSIITSTGISLDVGGGAAVPGRVGVENDWLLRLSFSQANLAAASSASFSVLYSVGYVC